MVRISKSTTLYHMEVYAYGNAAGAFLKLVMTNHAVSFVYFPESLVTGGFLIINIDALE